MSKIFLIFLFALVSISNSSDTIFIQEIKFDYPYEIHMSTSYDGYIIYSSIFDNKDTIDFKINTPVYFDEISYFFAPTKYPSLDQIPLEYFTTVHAEVQDYNVSYLYNFQAKEYKKDFSGLYVYFKPNTVIDGKTFTVYSQTSRGNTENDWIYIIIGIVLILVIWICCICGAVLMGKSVGEGCCCCLLFLACLCSGRR